MKSIEGAAMRPIHRGAPPNVYEAYQDAAADLQGRLGDYCSYCERQIETHLAVEHIQPKSHVPALINDWANFLLGCVHCNSCKGAGVINLPDYFWPDSDNTLRAVEYVRGGLVRPHPALPLVMQARAQATIELTGLDRDPGHPNPAGLPTPSDRRWLRRQEAWTLSEQCRDILLQNDTPEVRTLITAVVVGRGEFSIWWTAFAADVDMRRRLREAFVGTDVGCFDGNEHLQARAGGQV